MTCDKKSCALLVKGFRVTENGKECGFRIGEPLFPRHVVIDPITGLAKPCFHGGKMSEVNDYFHKHHPSIIVVTKLISTEGSFTEPHVPNDDKGDQMSSRICFSDGKCVRMLICCDKLC
jgi:hypothetical protein